MDNVVDRICALRRCVERDRISVLPDSIIHHIFSFLDTRSVVQTSSLSNRWRHLWESSPYLNFYVEGKDFHLSDDLQKLNDFMDFVDRVLTLRDASSIHKFTLICEEELYTTRVYTWLMAALKRCVQKLDLVLIVDQPMEFPHHLFTSNVKVLKLSGCFGDVNIRMPYSMCSANKIKTLDLDLVKLPDGDSNGELFLSCPVLKKLILSRCAISHLRMLTISCPLLESLELISGYDNEDDFCKIRICCPSLKSLMCVCDTHWDCSLERLPALTDAHIAILGDVEMEKEVYSQLLIKVLKGISNVKALKLSFHVLKALADPEILEMLPRLFHNLRDLTLEVGDDTFMMLNCAIANLLKTLPCIETFVLERYKDTALSLHEMGEGWEEGLPVQCVLHSLKTVKIYNSYGREDELKFLKFILEKAIFLKDIFITATTYLNLNKFRVHLLTLPRASSDVSIRFHLGVEA